MLTHSLGQYSFHGIWDAPGFDQVANAFENRPGVKGTTVHEIGDWGEPCAMETIQFVANWDTAIAVCKSYARASGNDPMVLINGGIVVAGGKYKVRKVVAKPKACVRTKIAGDATVYQGVVRATWELIPIADF